MTDNTAPTLPCGQPLEVLDEIDIADHLSACATCIGNGIRIEDILMTADNTAPTTRDYQLERVLLDHVHTPDGRCACGHRYVGPTTHLKVAYHVAEAILAAFPVLGAVTGTPDTFDRDALADALALAVVLRRMVPSSDEVRSSGWSGAEEPIQ